MTCGIGKPRSSLLRSLRISGARRVGRRLPLEAVLIAAVTSGIVALIEGEGENETRAEVPASDHNLCYRVFKVYVPCMSPSCDGSNTLLNMPGLQMSLPKFPICGLLPVKIGCRSIVGLSARPELPSSSLADSPGIH